MVVWEDLTRLITSNPEREFRVSNLTVGPKTDLERFPLPALTALTALTAVDDVEKKEEEDELPPPPPLKRTGARLNTEVAVVPVVPTNPIASRPPLAAAAVASSRPATVRPLERLKHAIDPITIGIELVEPLYLTAPYRSRNKMECEEGQRIEALVNDLYKSQGGRSRGWTKVGLDAMLKPRCASGGDLKELDRAKKAFLWPLVVDDKPTGAFLDFLCVAKGIRLAVWFDETKQVVLYPAADRPDAESTPPLYHVTAQGIPQLGLRTCSEFLAYCDSNNFVVMPPNSVLHSLEGLTLPDLESVGTKLGMTDLVGTKATRVAKIAVYKLRQRLAT
jgi:hypothetical protein